MKHTSKPSPLAEISIQGWEQYELLDLGHGWKLERFGSVVVQRPCPLARQAPARPKLWNPHLIYSPGPGQQGHWKVRAKLPEPWLVQFGPVVLQLVPSPAGQLGIFPEQSANWQWLMDHAELLQQTRGENDRGLLNLFAYTGGTTLAAAAVGVPVAHVDAARSAVRRAWSNARWSNLQDRPIRFLVDDARKFVQRELRRGCRYQAVVLDPPSYGHGPRGQVWQIRRHLPELLQLCWELSAPGPKLWLLTWHTRELHPRMVLHWIRQAGALQTSWLCGSMFLLSSTGRKLWSGYVIRAVWT